MPRVIATEEKAARKSSASMNRSFTRDSRRRDEGVSVGGGLADNSAAAATGYWRFGISSMIVDDPENAFAACRRTVRRQSRERIVMLSVFD